MGSSSMSDSHKELREKLQKAQAEELSARTPESKIGKMVEYLKQLGEDERIFCKGDSPGALVSGTLISITRQGIEHHGNLDGDYIDSVGPFTDDETKEIREQMQNFDAENDDIEDVDIEDIIGIIALRKKCDPKKKYYYAYISWYEKKDLEDIIDELEFYDTYEDAFQCFGTDVEYYDNLETWDELTNAQIEDFYTAALRYKTGEPVEQRDADPESEARALRAIAEENEKNLLSLLNRVLSVALSPDEKLIASKAYYFRMWDVKTGKQIKRIMTGYTENLYTYTFSPDSQLFAAVFGPMIRLVKTASGKEIHTFKGHEANVDEIAISPDNKLLASGGYDHSVRLWDINTGQELYNFQGHNDNISALCFSPTNKHIASGSKDNTVRVWDTASGEERTTFQGHGNSINILAFSPDGNQLASVSYDHTIRVWSISKGEELLVLNTNEGLVSAIRFLSESDLIAVGANDNTVLLWTNEGSPQLTLLDGHKIRVGKVAISPDGQCVASGDIHGGIHLWDVATGAARLSLLGHEQYISSLAFSTDGNHLISSSHDTTIRLWDTATGKELKKFVMSCCTL